MTDSNKSFYAFKSSINSVRRWLGIYTNSEREMLTYSKRIKRLSMSIMCGTKTITKRPEWMKYEDYKKMRALQKKVGNKNLKR